MRFYHPSEDTREYEEDFARRKEEKQRMLKEKLAEKKRQREEAKAKSK
jgi:hypothetical protein